MDSWDLAFYHDLFARTFRRNPTNVECFQLAQANSEHSRHWFFKGKLVIDGAAAPETLMEIIKSTLRANPANSVIAFKDNSSAIRGYEIATILPAAPGRSSAFALWKGHTTSSSPRRRTTSRAVSPPSRAPKPERAEESATCTQPEEAPWSSPARRAIAWAT